MRASEGVLGSPDYGAGLERFRLRRLLADAGNRPCVITGASGSGKSTLAARFAVDDSRTTIWIDAFGEGLRPVQIADSVELLLAQQGPETPRGTMGTSEQAAEGLARILRLTAESAQQAGVLIVLDDVHLLDGAADSDWLSALGSGLWRHGSRLVVTTRSVVEWQPRVLCQWRVLDDADLALDEHEACDLAQLLNYRATAEEVETVRIACAGHVAFFSAIIIQARRFGNATESARSTSLRAWLERAIRGSISDEDQRALRLASLLRKGDLSDLAQLGVDDPLRTLLRLSAALPLIRVQVAKAGDGHFVVHDLVDGFFCESETVDKAALRGVVRLLSERGDYARACTLLLRLGDADLSTRWLKVHGEAAAIGSGYGVLDKVISTLPLAGLMCDASLLVLWARVCLETGKPDEALAKARAGRPVALHDRDAAVVREAISISLTALRIMGKFDEAKLLADEVVDGSSDFVDNALLAEGLLCIGASSISAGDSLNAEAPLREAVRLAESTGQFRIRGLASNALGLVPPLARGDFAEGKRQLAGVARGSFGSPTVDLMIRGNLAMCLVELGRHEWAAEVLHGVLRQTADFGLEHLRSAYLPTLGVVIASEGALSSGTQPMREGIMIAESLGDRGDAAASRVHLSLVLLAAGRIDEALKEAEMALEVLSVQNAMGFKLHAQFQVAACLLAGGDTTAARTWVETRGRAEELANQFTSLRAAVVLAEADRLDGDVDRGVIRFKPFADYVRSESPNLQLAMYSQAFPALPAMLSRAGGLSALPAHMLRMIPPESAEATLLVSRDFLEPALWRDLGRRMLGNEEFQRFLARDGVPMCLVRLFGGLEVSVGGRSVRERDWKKRKARLLFVMLMIRNGHDVARDQLFETLWPGMEIERAKSNLYVTWSLVKSVLMGNAEKGTKCPYIESVGGVCHALPDMVRTDVGDFERAVLCSREAEKEGDAREALLHYQRIGDLYRGDLLPADCYDDWFSGLREHYRVEFVSAMLRAADLLMGMDDPSAALIFVRRAIRCDQNREDLYQVALRCQIAAGQRSSAIDTYFTCRTRLSEELGLDPSAETRALYDEILAMEDRPRPIPGDSYLD